MSICYLLLKTVSGSAPALALALLALVAAACGSGGSSEVLPSDIPSGLELVIYRDSLSNTVLAHSPADGRLWKYTGESQNRYVVSVDCTKDGGRAAYLVYNLQGSSDVTLSDKDDKLATVSGQPGGLSWSPDSAQLAVTSVDQTSLTNQLLLVDASSGQTSQAASGRGAIGQPRWSPSGEKILFDALDDTVNRVYLHTIGIPGATKLVDRATHAFAPDWSPDGNSILYGGEITGAASQLFTANADGTGERQLTSSQVAKGYPRWAPDGSLIAFAGTIAVPAVSARPALVHNLAVYTMNPDATNEVALTDLAADARLLGWCVSGPWLAKDWSPGG